MRVKIRDTWYDANDEPIMVVLSRGERKQISQMAKDSAGKYCQFPEGTPSKQIEAFMEIVR